MNDATELRTERLLLRAWRNDDVEFGWPLVCSAWGQGFAPEAARTAVALGFNELGLQEIVSFTVPDNVRSRRVMERIDMRHDPEGDFEHPLLAEQHPLRKHVLYRLPRPVPVKGL